MYISLADLHQRDLATLREPVAGKISILVEHNRTAVSGLCRFALDREGEQVYAVTKNDLVLQVVGREQNAQVEQRRGGRLLEFSGSATLVLNNEEQSRAWALLGIRYGKKVEGTLIRVQISRVARLNL